jgi:dTDP-4-amino-4,6-dideoxygalactose transaminase
MYFGGLHCLSFHARKLLNIGEGGMVLTDDLDAYNWLRKARYSGRDKAHGYRIEEVTTLGWQAYMTPEKAARGLHLMDYVEDWPDQVIEYPDLREAPLFKMASAFQRAA